MVIQLEASSSMTYRLCHSAFRNQIFTVFSCSLYKPAHALYWTCSGVWTPGAHFSVLPDIKLVTIGNLLSLCLYVHLNLMLFTFCMINAPCPCRHHLKSLPMGLPVSQTCSQCGFHRVLFKLDKTQIHIMTSH